ncbi:MAG: hypothetical protein WAQ24_00945 [Candidatus Saccharimonadales bacterium]
MKRVDNEAGSSTALLIGLIGVSLLFFGAAGFGVWAFMGRQDYKKNVDAKIATAVEANTKQVQLKDAKDYAEAVKQPLKPYIGPEAYGSVHINYPKTWSAYVVSGNSGQPLDMYAQQDVVPSVTDQNSVFALRVQVMPRVYSQAITQYQALQKQGKITVAPYALPKVPTVTGLRIDGQITPTKRGSLVIMPMRDKTLTIWTESDQFLGDFNNIILPNASFSP